MDNMKVKVVKKGNGNPLQDSRLENSIDRGVWQATVYGVIRKEWDTTEPGTILGSPGPSKVGLPPKLWPGLHRVLM